MQIQLNCDDNELDIIDKINAGLKPIGIVLEDDGDAHDGYVILNVKVEETMRDAVTQVFDDGQMCWDHNDGLPNTESIIGQKYEFVRRLTNYA